VIEKNEPNLSELRKLFVSLFAEVALLGIKNEILSSIIKDEECLLYRPGKKRRRKQDSQLKKVCLLLVQFFVLF
jgi:hypothetical protein